jgi:hypothetical protein
MGMTGISGVAVRASGASKPSTALGPRPVKHTETGSPFDVTVVPAAVLDPPGAHGRTTAEPDPNAFSGTFVRTARPDPRSFLHSRAGYGGDSTSRRRMVATGPLAHGVRRRPAAPKAGAATYVVSFWCLGRPPLVT